MRWRLGTTSHPKIVRLMQTCGERAFRALATLWEYTAGHHEDGCLNGMDAIDIAIAACWPDAPESFVTCLLQSRLLEQKRGSFAIHDWKDEQPFIFNAAKRVEDARIAGLASANARSTTRQRPVERPVNDPFNPPSTPTYLPTDLPK